MQMDATQISVIHSAGKKQASDITTPPTKGMDDFCRQP